MVAPFAGPIQPRVFGRLTPDGMLVVQSNPANSDLWKAIVFGVLCAFLVSLLVVAAGPRGFDWRAGRVIGGVVTMWGIASAASHAYLTRRRVRRGALLVTPWPIRLGEQIDAKFRVTLRESSTVQHVKGWLQCMEQVTHGVGRDRVVDQKTIFSCELPAQPHPAGQRAATAEWKTQVPAMLPPSMEIPSNAIRWFIVAATCSDDVWVPLYFELLVLPEVVGD